MLLRILPILILLCFSGLARSEEFERRAPRVPMTAGKSCELNYANLDAAIAERRTLRESVYRKIDRLRTRYGEFRSITSADNKNYLILGRKCNRGEDCGAKIFFEVVNAVLKELNDKVVLDKDLVTALTNLHKDILWEMIQADPLLQKHMVAKYSDFKTLRFAFDTDTPEFRDLLRRKVMEAGHRYKGYVDDLAKTQGWDERSRGLTADSRNWFHAGVGINPDLAGAASTCSRRMLGAAGLAVMRSFEECVDQLTRRLRKVDLYQKWAQKRFLHVEGFLVDAELGCEKFEDPAACLVVSAEAIEMFKKTMAANNTPEAKLKAWQEAAQHRFHLNLSLAESRALGDMMAGADEVSPGLLMDERVVIDMNQEAAGVISADFKGQNARNMEETLKALLRSRGQSMAKRLQAVRAGEEIATTSLEEKKARFQRVLGRLVPGLKGEFTGDDGIGFLYKMLTPAEKKAFAKYWKEEGGEPGDLRLTYEEFVFADTKGRIPGPLRSGLVIEAEAVEKYLRAELIKGVLPRKELNSLQIVVSMDANSTRRNSVSLYLRKEGKPLPREVEGAVRRLLEKKGIPLSLYLTELIP